MKNIKKLSLLLSLLACAACSSPSEKEKPATSSQTGDPITLNQDEKEEKANKLNQFYDLRYKISDKVTQPQLLDLDIETKIKWDEKELTLNQTSQEKYDQGEMKSYYATITSTNGIDQSYYYDGVNYYSRINEEAWGEVSGESTDAGLFIGYLRFILDDPSIWQIEEKGDLSIVTKEVLDPSLLNHLTTILSLPLELSPQADISGQLVFEVETQTGEFNNLKLDLSIKDLDQDYFVSTNLDVDYKEGDISVDLDQEPVYSVDTDKNTSTKFQEANPKDGYHHYDMNVYYSEGLEETVPSLYAMNFIADSPHLNYIIDFNGEEISQVKLNFAGLPDYYKNCSVYFIANESTAELLDAEDGDELTYRIIQNDFSAIESLLQGVDLADLKSKGDYTGLDFIIDKNTMRLKQVIVWSTKEDDETIENYIVLSFTNFNNRWNNLASYYLTDEDWKEVQLEESPEELSNPSQSSSESSSSNDGEETSSVDENSDSDENNQNSPDQALSQEIPEASYVPNPEPELTKDDIITDIDEARRQVNLNQD